jgi:hypothetical protein
MSIPVWLIFVSPTLVGMLAGMLGKFISMENPFTLLRVRLQNLLRSGVTQTDRNEQKAHPAPLRYFQSMGILSVVITVAGMVAPWFFWWAVTFVWIMFFIMVLDASFYRYPNPWLKRTYVAALFAACAWFTLAIVFPPATLGTSVEFVGVHPTVNGGTVSAPITSFGYYETDVDFVNESDADYSDLELTLGTDIYIINVAENEPHHGGIEFRPNTLNPITKATFPNGFTRILRPPSFSKSETVFLERLRKGDVLSLIVITCGAIIPTSPATGLPVRTPEEQVLTQQPEWVAVEAKYKSRFYRPRYMTCRASKDKAQLGGIAACSPTKSF